MRDLQKIDNLTKKIINVTVAMNFLYSGDGDTPELIGGNIAGIKDLKRLLNHLEVERAMAQNNL
tara:strand:+ start:9000 stop:9191 length:192 start_codon:yes stop_codon:yes gene_type:complete